MQDATLFDMSNAAKRSSEDDSAPYGAAQQYWVWNKTCVQSWCKTLGKNMKCRDCVSHNFHILWRGRGLPGCARWLYDVDSASKLITAKTVKLLWHHASMNLFPSATHCVCNYLFITVANIVHHSWQLAIQQSCYPLVLPELVYLDIAPSFYSSFFHCSI